MVSKCFLLFLSLWVLGVAGLSALDIQRGKIKVTFNDRTGRFVVWGTEDQAKPTWTALYLGDDPTTTKWKLLVGNKAFVLGDDPTFTTKVEATTTGARVTWTSSTLVATLTADFLVSTSSAVADGLQVSLGVVNVSKASQSVGIRWVVDTYLGEKKDPFQVSPGTVIRSETKLEGTLPDWWASRSAINGQLGLLVMVGKGVTPPSRVVFANWKRLDDSLYDPGFKAGRDFSLLPYSFNDSAVAQFYDPQDLASGATRTVTVLLGLWSAQTFEGARLASPNPLDDLLKKSQNPALGALDQDVANLDALLAQIDAKLTDPSKVSPEDLRLLQAALDQVDARRKTLEAPKP